MKILELGIQNREEAMKYREDTDGLQLLFYAVKQFSVGNIERTLVILIRKQLLTLQSLSGVHIYSI